MQLELLLPADHADHTDHAEHAEHGDRPDRATRPGGRTARVRAAVRAATLAELGEKGYQGLTVEAVAERSGVHKTTVYRRWGNVEGLIADALELASGEPWPVPDTGALDTDLRALTREVLAGFTDPESGPVATAFVSAAVQNPAAARALHAFFAARHEQSAPVVRRAMARGELPADTDPAEVVRVAVAPLYYRLFVSGEPVDAAVADRAADAALAAARAGALRAAPPPAGSSAG
ncbi:TetR/AcrR family transcriptional regulator [Micromonospora sp. C28SCA-DRY-2]|uniref:TetR/AcrR family transcriptional regulator n=1 Tax=Micromonospora sp. C28SCA-DRY-2 TaxID=3059522 RepID=UPI00267758ED|nr:TetR/AcrR family transcriptional regulator [Micromonospora sp. C28SCA-DRY-2]MDO3702266.1 TetR/AcrR family transcriptional regulator [Micromonospora sp. C28SCA-DRY-2]